MVISIHLNHGLKLSFFKEEEGIRVELFENTEYVSYFYLNEAQAKDFANAIKFLYGTDC